MPHNKPFRILIVDDIHPALIYGLEELPEVEVDDRPDLTAAQAAALLPGYDGLVVRSKLQLSGAVLAPCTRLQFIARAGAGMDNIDEGAARQLGIRLFNAPEGNRQAVAEHVVGMLLTLFNKLRSAHQSISAGQWLREEHRGEELSGKTVGLIGFGNNGMATAKVLSGFGCEVLAYDKYKTGFSSEYAKEASLERLFEHCDVLSLHLPLNSESRQMINSSFIGAFHKPIYLINAARGEIVVLADLVEALEKGKVLGACLDVLENEKPGQWDAGLMERLFRLPQVVLSPHVAGWTTASYQKIAQVLLEKLRAEFFVH